MYAVSLEMAPKISSITVLFQTSYHAEYVIIFCLLHSIISHRNFFLNLTEINQTPEPPIQLHSQGYTKMLLSFFILLPLRFQVSIV